jgi:hypothetical protein
LKCTRPKGAHVGPAGLLGEPERLPRVEQVADEQRDCRAGKDSLINNLRRQAEDEAAEAVDEQKLNEIVERKTEEPVDVASNERSHGSELYQSYCRVTTRSRPVTEALLRPTVQALVRWSRAHRDLRRTHTFFL